VDNPEKKGIGPNLISGLFVIAVGVVLLLDHMGIVSARQFFHFWPLFLVFIGLAHLFQSCRIGGRIWGGFLILMGASLQLNELGYVHLSFSEIWPVFIILAGIMLIVRELEGGSLRVKLAAKIGEAQKSGKFYGFRFTPSDDSSMDSVSIFGGSKRRITSKDFRGGRVMAFCGGFQIDLREADMQGDEAVIDASAVLGGGEIRVPYNWNVMVQGLGIFGGYVDETQAFQQAGQPPITNPAAIKHLIVKGVAIFGGIVVKN
jgi:predicted membrane protein